MFVKMVWSGQQVSSVIQGNGETKASEGKAGPSSLFGVNKMIEHLVPDFTVLLRAQPPRH